MHRHDWLNPVITFLRVLPSWSWQQEHGWLWLLGGPDIGPHLRHDLCDSLGHAHAGLATLIECALLFR
jgi:hypothetical protein